VNPSLSPISGGGATIRIKSSHSQSLKQGRNFVRQHEPIVRFVFPWSGFMPEVGRGIEGRMWRSDGQGGFNGF
jgi:hypothetical protein